MSFSERVRKQTGHYPLAGHGGAWIVDARGRSVPHRAGTTQMFALTLVYNQERTGEVRLDGRRFWFRRVPRRAHDSALSAA